MLSPSSVTPVSVSPVDQQHVTVHVPSMVMTTPPISNLQNTLNPTTHSHFQRTAMPAGSRPLPWNNSSSQPSSTATSSSRPTKRRRGAPGSSQSASSAPRSSQSSRSNPIYVDSDDEDEDDFVEVSSTPAQPEVLYTSLGYIGTHLYLWETFFVGRSCWAVLL